MHSCKPQRMRFFFVSDVFFSFICLPAALAVVPTSQSLQTRSIAFSDITYSSLYKIINCNANLPARLYSEAKQLQEFLPQVWNSNDRLLTDITNGTNSKYGFGALFKSNTSINIVASTFRNMRYGSGPGSQVATMICLDDDTEDPVLQPLHNEICVPGTLAAVIPNSSYIGFCPSFFVVNRRGLDFPIRADCPVVTANSIQNTVHPLMDKTYPTFLSQMLRLQIGSGSIEEETRNQVTEIQDCINLNAMASLTNIANWVYYAACEFSASWLWDRRVRS